MPVSMKCLDSNCLKQFLIISSLYISAYEILKDSIVKRIDDFFMVGAKCRNWDNKREYDEEMQPYRKKHQDKKLYASFEWLLENFAITDEDWQNYESLRKLRNRLAHEMMTCIVENIDDSTNEIFENFKTMISLIKKIEIWWIKNVEIPCNPEFDGLEVVENEIVPGPVLGIQMLMNAAFER